MASSLPHEGHTETGLHVVRKLLAHEDVTGLTVSDSDPFKAIVDRVQNANGEGRLGAFRAAIEGVPGEAEIIGLVLSGDPKADAPKPRRARVSSVAALPPEARPDPEVAAQTGAWL